MTERAGGGRKFPETRRSAVLGLSANDAVERARAYEALVRAYHRAVYTHVRLTFGRSREEAEDLTQGFFARVFEKRGLAHYDPAKARFRTFLKTCLDGFVMEEARAQRRLKRGGGAIVLGLDFDGVERDLDRVAASAKTADPFDAAWTRSMLAAGLAGLERLCRAQGKESHLAIFRRYALTEEEERPTYAQIARELDLSLTDVTNRLAWARRNFRAILIEELRAVTADEEDFRAEARALLGTDP